MIESSKFKITHPFHPLKDKEFDIVNIKEYWGKKYVIFTFKEGDSKAIPIEWTDLEAEDLFKKISKGRSLFKTSDLLELYNIIQAVKKDN